MHVVEGSDLTAEQVSKIATTLDVSEQDVIDMTRRLAAPDYSLNALIRSEGDIERQDWLVDETVSQETDVADREELSGRRALLPKALAILNERERHILNERRLRDRPVTLDVLAQHYGISRERVRQIELRAFAKVQKEMQTQVNTRRDAAAWSS